MNRKVSATDAAIADLRETLSGDIGAKQLEEAMLRLARWRARLLGNTVLAQSGSTVAAGPFAGMVYDVLPEDETRVPRLLGCFESTLAPVIEAICASDPRLIIDVGAGEGFYAVGLAMRLPLTTVWARDSNRAALELCEHLAETNGVAGRVKTGGKLTHADFDICRAQHTVVLCDIEGGEDALLDPDRAKGLRRADILVEVHEDIRPGLTDRMIARFEATHDIRRFDRHASTDALPAWMEGLSDLDRLLALWETRPAPTPWLWMTARHR